MDRILTKLAAAKDFLRNNWFKSGILIVLVIGVGMWIKFQYETLRLERYKAEQSAFKWAYDNGLGKTLVGTKELRRFSKHFWDLFDY